MPEDINGRDIGNGWYATWADRETDVETLTLRNPDRGQRITLRADEVARLRELMKAEG